MTEEEKIDKENEMIIRFMYPKLFEDGVKPENFHEIADKEYSILHLAFLVLVEDVFNGNVGLNRSHIRYKTSWDWLMPVISKCQETLSDLLDQQKLPNQFSDLEKAMTNIEWGLITVQKEIVFKHSIEFIESYNNR